jgi:hypothetical protein
MELLTYRRTVLIGTVFTVVPPAVWTLESVAHLDGWFAFGAAFFLSGVTVLAGLAFEWAKQAELDKEASEKHIADARTGGK